ncbi:MAG: hypothetical protein JWL98_377 [Xanthomonadaceae bacterium]|nr:hypothetical protein [Xanthomonadaceae bacterium]
MAGAVQRALRHLFAGSAHALYPEAALQQLAATIAEGEATHQGQVVFAVESALPVRAVLAGQTPRQRAVEVFSRLRVWDTECNNGVLIYLLIADRRIEIVADRAIAARVGDDQWRGVCQQMEDHLKGANAQAAAIAGAAAVSALLAEHFPRGNGDSARNELSDRPHILG